MRLSMTLLAQQICRLPRNRFSAIIGRLKPGDSYRWRQSKDNHVAQKRTRWHQDQPYYPVDGQQVWVIWMPVDQVAAESSLECIRGSHRWKRFGENEHTFERMPDIDNARASYDIASWDMAPGDRARSPDRLESWSPSDNAKPHRPPLTDHVHGPL
jgi:Phytanoyl-CoA dioxygenase (PhyH)